MNPGHRSPQLALLTLLAGAACIGVAPILVRLSQVGPGATAFYRILFALPVLWWWMQADNQQAHPLSRPATRRDFPALALAGLFFTADLGLWHWSLQFTTVTNATLLTNFAPLFVTLGAWLLFGERITWRFLVSLALALLGASLLVGLGLESDTPHLLGDALAVLTATFYGAYLLAVKRLRRHFSGLTIMAWSGLVSCPGFLLAGWIMGETLWPASLSGWLVVLALALISHLGGQTFIAIALGHLPASFSSLGLLLQPVVAAVLAWFLFQERLAATQILGGLVVLASIALATQKRSTPRPPIPTST